METITGPVRVAIAGCGRIARVHCSYLRGIPNVRIVAAADPVEQAVKAIANDFQIANRFTDYREMLHEIRPHVMHVITPPATHAEVAIAAMERGAHVLVEKPMAISEREADAMVAVAARTGRSLAVDHNRWFDPVVQRAATLVGSGAMGEIVGVDVFQGAAVEEMRSIASGTKGNWRSELPGGVMHDSAPHPAYLLRNFLGPIESIEVLRLVQGGVLQELRALARAANALGSLTISMRARPFTNSVRILGTRMTAEVNLNNMTLVTRRERQVPKLVGKVLPNLDEAAQLVAATVKNTAAFVTGRQRFFPGMGVLFRRFYDHLTTGSPSPTTGEDGREVVRVLDALWGESTAHEQGRASA